MKKQKKSSFSIKPIICLALLALCIIITSAVKGHAAGKKTVRVTTQDELVDAINNANVGTIILRSETRDAITIASNENAKGKKIVIDVPYATVTNKAKFKYITVSGASMYKEAVSGNTIEIPTYYLANLELAKKKSIKKLVLTGYTGFEEIDMYSIVRKGAKIKNIVFKNYAGTTAMDKSTRTLTFEEEAFEWCEPTVVTIKFDKSGRMIFRSEDYESEYENDTEYTYTYDKNGNMVEAIGYVYYDEEKTDVESRNNTYDKKNRVKTSINRGRYSALVYSTSYEYDSKGRVLRSVTECSTIDGDKGDGTYDNKSEYTYDKKNRVTKMVYEYTDSNSYDDNVKIVTITEYEYNDKGFLTTEKSTDSSKPGQYSLNSYSYDKYGNNTKDVFRNYDGEISTNESSYNELGEWESSVWTYPNGEQYIYTPETAG